MKKLFLTLLLPTVTYAQVYVGKGEHSVCGIAESKAYEHALKQANGMLMESVESYTCKDTSNKHPSCQYQKEAETYAAGQIKSVISTRTSVRNGVCHAQVEVTVDKPNSIYATVSGYEEFRHGDSVSFTIDARQPVYMYVFSVHAKGVDLIYPIDYNKDYIVQGKFKFPEQYPDPNNQFTLRAWLPNGQDVANEKLVFVFSKAKLEFTRENIRKEHVEELVKTIPVYSRRVVYKNFSVYR